MNDMRRVLLVILVAVALGGIGGCTCCSQVPVSLESINNWFLFHSPACRQYPYSCPSCPYFSGEPCVQAGSTEEQTGGEGYAQPPESGVKNPAEKSSK